MTTPDVRLIDILHRGAALAPDRIAVSHGASQITYRRLLSQAQCLAHRLKAVGLEPGARVGLLWENSIDYVTTFFGITWAGLTVVPLDHSLKPQRVAYILNDCSAEGLIVQGKLARRLTPLPPVVSRMKLILTDEPDALPSSQLWSANSQLSQGETEFARSDIRSALPLTPLDHRSMLALSDEMAALFYTSGSTGEPKGVMLSHRNLISNTIATVEYLSLTGDDTIMVLLPFYYIYGNSLMLTHLLVGARMVLDNRFAFPQVILQTMARERVTGFSGVPSTFMMLLDRRGFSSEALPHLRYLTQAGGAMAPEVTKRVIQAFVGKEIFIMYGQTEAAPRVSYCPPARLAEKLGSIGVPVPGVDIRIINEGGQECPVGEVGEIVVRGDNVMLGYWNQPEEQAEVLRNRRLHTGDLGYRDADGYFWVTGRKKEIIKVGGNRVSAKEIEERILENDKVLEAAVVGVSDDVLGEAIKAVVVLKEGQKATAREIQDYIGLRLARHKIPKYIIFTDALPKYPSGKVRKQELSQSL